jgi:hypothetical protein
MGSRADATIPRVEHCRLREDAVVIAYIQGEQTPIERVSARATTKRIRCGHELSIWGCIIVCPVHLYRCIEQI